MMKLSVRAASCAVFLVGSTAGAFAQEKTLNVVGAGGSLQDAQRHAYYEPFASAFDVNVIEESYSGAMAKVEAMVRTDTVTYDVMQVEQDDVVTGCEEGLFEPLDWAELGDPADFVESATMAECGVGYFVWSMVFTYDRTKTPEGPQTWAEFWDTDIWPGRRGLRKTPKMTLELALMADGVSVDEIYDVLSTPEGQDRAFAKLDEIKEHVVWWTSGAQPIERLAAGDVEYSAAFNGRVSNANLEGKDFALEWDGQIYGMDFWAIVKGTPRLDLAKQFITHAIKPEQQARFPEKILYGITNKAALEGLEPALLSQLPTAEANLAVSLPLSSDFWIDNQETLSKRFETWLSSN
jgi:putative spermidine/putrescine transport system substrate-binding protein